MPHGMRVSATIVRSFLAVALALATTAVQADPPANIRKSSTALLNLLPRSVRTVSAKNVQAADDIITTPQTRQKVQNLIEDVLEPEIVIEVREERSKLIRTKRPVSRTSITDPSVAEMIQFSPTEFELIGVKLGETTLTLWFGDDPNRAEVIRYLVKVLPDTSEEDELRSGYAELEKKIHELWPNSLVQLIPVLDKLIVRGTARDAEELAQIMNFVRGGSGQPTNTLGGMSQIGQGTAINPLPGRNDLRNSQVINLMRVAGEHQVMLRVRFAELSRSALRQLGADFSVTTSNFSLSSMLGSGTGNITALLDNQQVSLFLQAVASNSYSKVLAEPNVVVISGNTASFIAGGQFAVPTAVGVNGVGAATTTFQGFGAQLLCTPTVLDKDLIRLQVTPTLSSLNQSNTVNGIPGLTVRSANTIVDMREGQWLAIAGLIEDDQNGSSTRVPGLGAIPGVNVLFNRRQVKRDETELVILVSPLLVHPMEADQLPLLLPGMEVTEPGLGAFYVAGRIEGRANQHYRSTVAYGHYLDQREAIRKAKRDMRYFRCEHKFVRGAHGFSGGCRDWGVGKSPTGKCDTGKCDTTSGSGAK